MRLAYSTVGTGRFPASLRPRSVQTMNTWGDDIFKTGPEVVSTRTVASIVVSSTEGQGGLPAAGAVWLAGIRNLAAAILRVPLGQPKVAELEPVPQPSALDRALDRAEARLRSDATAGELLDQVQRALGVSSGDVQRALRIGRTTTHHWKQKTLDQVRGANRQRLRDALAAALLWQDIGEGRSVAPLYRARIDGRTLQGLLSDASLDLYAIEHHLRKLPEEFRQLGQAQARQQARQARGFDPFEGYIDP